MYWFYGHKWKNAKALQQEQKISLKIGLTTADLHWSSKFSCHYNQYFTWYSTDIGAMYISKKLLRTLLIFADFTQWSSLELSHYMYTAFKWHYCHAYILFITVIVFRFTTIGYMLMFFRFLFCFGFFSSPKYFFVCMCTCLLWRYCYVWLYMSTFLENMIIAFWYCIYFFKSLQSCENNCN